ncbi:MAG: bifunctional hydroxymethylpyrimidine kinase/phosphomethylpyrimidine kinase [Hyphomicrobiales bacterium]|nr:bifunctional hydroxymethylpyrimidine kinase/phosphomethylpyrimidine kinase [Hyphomicrobiales bacterium]
MSRYARARVLVIAGSDSSGGAGIQADCKIITALGGYAASAITALTAQNTLGVHGVFKVSADFVRAQIRAVLEDIGADALKSGMLVNAEIIEAVAEEIRNAAKGGGKIPYVLDPVMVAKGGAALLSPDAVGKLREMLVPLADVVTPNIPEARELTGITIRSESDARKAGEALLEMGAKAALVKGGHGDGDELVDVLVLKDGKSMRFPNKRIDTVHTHGTGCSLASAIAVLLAKGLGLHEAVEQALAHVRRGIVEAPGFGKGHGPIAHAFH